MRWIGKNEAGDTVTLKKFEGQFECPDFATDEWLEEHSAELRTALVVDTETTGLDPHHDKVIEVGIKLFRYSKETSQIVSMGKGYSALEDPEEPLSAEITRLTGLTDEDLKGQKIDWAHVESLFEEADLVIAHNASFDRAFLDKRVEVSQEKVWACTLQLIDWRAKGFPTAKLEVLNIFHGFFTDSHRALHDVEALLHLLSFPDPENETPYLKELLENARRPRIKLFAENSPYETKDILKRRGYRWEPGKRCWVKTIYQDAIDNEKSWLASEVYTGEFLGRVVPVRAVDQFKRT